MILFGRQTEVWTRKQRITMDSDGQQTQDYSRGTWHVFLGLAIYKCSRGKVRQFNLHIVCRLYLEEKICVRKKYIYILTNIHL